MQLACMGRTLVLALASSGCGSISVYTEGTVTWTLEIPDLGATTWTSEGVGPDTLADWRAGDPEIGGLQDGPADWASKGGHGLGADLVVIHHESGFDENRIRAYASVDDGPWAGHAPCGTLLADRVRLDARAKADQDPLTWAEAKLTFPMDDVDGGGHLYPLPPLAVGDDLEGHVSTQVSFGEEQGCAPVDATFTLDWSFDPDSRVLLDQWSTVSVGCPCGA